MAVYGGSIKHTSVLGLGGAHVSNDIAVGLRTPSTRRAGQEEFGVAAARFLGSDDVISVPSVGGRRPREVSRSSVRDHRAAQDEILSLARQSLVKEGSRTRSRRVVLTGGCSALEGVPDLAEEIFETPVRIGIPCRVAACRTWCAGRCTHRRGARAISAPRRTARTPGSDPRRVDLRGVKQRMRDWFFQFE